jgi:hypothetical protein
MNEVLKVTTTGILHENGTVLTTWELTPTLSDMVDALIDAGIVVATSGYFIGDELASCLRPGQLTVVGQDTTLMRRNFFPDATVRRIIVDYYARVLHLRLLPPTLSIPDSLATSIQDMTEYNLGHMCLWVAYHLIEKRRLYETSNEMLGQSNWSDGTGSFNSGGQPKTSTTVTVGSVFSMTDDNTSGYIDAEFDRIGSLNTLGDAYSFWYRLQVDLRSRLETRYGDFSLRPDDVMMGKIILEKPLNYFAYYDSYPYTLSPLSRGIL